MEILFVSHKYPPSVGGMEKQSYELIKGMAAHARVHTIVYTGLGGKFMFFWTLRKKIMQKCLENPGISVIHFNDGLIGAICAKHKGYSHLKRVVTLHGLEVVFPNPWYQKYILPRFNNFDRIIAVSAATRDACIERGLLPDKVVVVPNGVDHDLAKTVRVPDFPAFFEAKYQISVKNKRIFVGMGRAVQRKGFSWFMENVVPSLQGDFVLLLIGPFNRERSGFARFLSFLPNRLSKQIALFLGFPSDEDHLRDLLVEPRFQGKVYHMGKLPFDDIRQILAASNAFVMPNISIKGDMEGFGLVCLEAALSGTTVVASRLEGITEAIQDGKNGILLPSCNAQAWVDQLQAIIDHPAAFEAKTDDYRAYTLEVFGWDKMVSSYASATADKPVFAVD
jgi:phosphatidylinositol alpha-1,6-mannosyltransferase